MPAETTTTPTTAAIVATAAPVAAPAVAASTTEPHTPADDGGAAPADDAGDDKKDDLTPEQRENRRLKRRIERLLGQRGELRERLAQTNHLTDKQPAEKTDAASDSEPISLSRAELSELIDKRAKELAPRLAKEAQQDERRRGVAERLAKDWGREKFDSYARDLNDAFDGLQDGSGRPKAATEAIFDSEDPRSLIEYLADPDHADEAEALSEMGPIAAGRAIAKLEAKLEAKRKEAKPQPSAAPAPIETSRGGGTATSQPQDSDSIDVWLQKERKRLAAKKG